MLNITHIIGGDLWAGAESQAYLLIAGLSKYEDICVNVITFNHGILVEKLLRAGVSVDVIAEKHNNIFKMLWRIYYVLRKAKAEIIHTHGYKETFLGGLAAKLCDVKTIVRTYHGKGIMDVGFKYKLIEGFNRHFITDRIIAVSEDLKNYLILKKFNKKIITVIRNGINSEAIKPSESTGVLKDELNISNRDYVIGTVGRLVPVKGHKYFIEGAKNLLAVNDKAIFVIVGDGPLMPELDQQIKELGISDNVKLLGFREDVISVMNLFDLFVMTSLHEGIPMVLLEAMSLSKPVIATKVGGIPEIISNNQNGFLIPPKDPEALATACLDLIDNKDLRTRLAGNAKKDAEYKFSNKQAVNNTAELYKGFF